MDLGLVDSHCHLDLVAAEPALGGLDAVLASARASGVGHILCVGVTISRLPPVIELAERLPGVFASVGLHPNERVALEPSAEEIAALSRHPRVVAIGETGLDYYRSEGDPDWQRERFRRHIAAARAVGQPLIIHSRSAPAETLRILREERADAVGGVMHCFTEDWATAVGALDLGFYISLSGIVTFPRAEALQDVARRVPLERLLIETDAPWLAPVPHRGKPNQPAYVRHVADHIARLRGMPVEDLGRATSDNFFRLFPRASRESAAS